MRDEPLGFDKETARSLIEARLRRLGVNKGELARALYMSASVFSRKLSVRYAYDRFTTDEVQRLAGHLDLTAAERYLLLRCYGHIPPAGSGARSSTGHRPRTNLPVALTSFVGRVQERAEVERLLMNTRLLTLTGTGGCGKTRLALEVAGGLLARWPDGVWLVELAALPAEGRGGADPASARTVVAQAVAAATGVRETAGRPLSEALIEAFRPQRLLLVLDNCEHVVGACAALAEALLRACPAVTILATSRELLGVSGETAFRVSSLGVPVRMAERVGSHPALSAPGLLTDAEQLLVDRIRLHVPGFTVTERNREALAQICRRLDGIPLAIELAAARTVALSLEQIASRLDNSFSLLTNGGRTALPRHQTLRAAMDWSYDLLSELERTVFRRLAVFAGGFVLDMAESVCFEWGQDASDGGPGEKPWLSPSPRTEAELLDLLTQLVRKSLVLMEEHDGEVRYRLLEPVRQYAEQRLRETGEMGIIRRRHRNALLTLTEQAEPALIGPDRERWVGRLEQEHDNLRAALAWSIQEEPDSEAALRLAGALWRFWQERGYLSEGRRWLEGALAMAGDVPLAVRARALHGAGVLAREQGDYTRAVALYEEALVHWRYLDDTPGIAATLNSLGMILRDQGDLVRARQHYEEALTLRRELGERHGVAATLNNLALLLSDLGDIDQAVALHEESLAIKRALDDRRGIAASLNNLGMVARMRGETERAMTLYTDSLALFRELGDTWGVGVLLNNLADVALDQGAVPRAATLFAESLALRRDLGDKPGIAWCLEGLAAVIGAEGHHRSVGAELLGAAEALREGIGAAVPLAERTRRDRTVFTLRTAMGDAAFAAAWSRGRVLPLDQAIERALAEAHDEA